ncbi:diguanylate cyclase domain-containing protein [Mariprofundus ferrooxydans]|uniref:Sensory box-containing diguanylate cyclase, putative n=1 Tax=Mariprofundus ferrooxydans PV-1 TaxID=314345 RepID=Q0EYI6_9PROT|nr:diguanylate cyclase [Mariprofundus ferrooxydans]EAU54381.1 sensory box-containing diguanylate cyclase, putative [Mariprofundus ferrooxydans PV-1]KON47403.1 diguanylate cyclase [Mariprofundus ferrooxydans]
MHKVSLKKRIFLPLIVVGLVVAVTGIFFVNHLEEHQKNDVVLQEAESIQSHLQSALDSKAEVMAASLGFIVQNRDIIAALRAGDRQRLLKLAAPIYQRLHAQYNITHFYFHNAQRVNLLRVHKPEKYGDTINRFTALGAEKSGALFSGIELGPLGTFTLRSVLPVFDSGKLIGYMELGQEIDTLIQQTRAMFHVDLLMLIDKQYLERGAWEEGMRMLGRPFDWNMLASKVLISQSLNEIPVTTLNRVAAVPAQEGISIGQDIILHGRTYWAGIIPVHDAGDRPVATLVVLRDMTQIIARLHTEFLLFSSVLAVMGLFVFSLFYLILGRTERALSESEERFEKISESAQDAIICMDNDGNISFWNQAAETTFGYAQEEVMGKNLHTLIVPERFRDAHLKAFPLFQSTGQGSALGKTLELAAIRKDGTEFPIEIALSSTRIAGKWNAVAVLRDITIRKQAQQEIELTLHVQRVLDTILNISLPPLTLTEVTLKALDAILSIPAFSLLSQGSIFLVVKGERKLEMVAQRNLPDSLLQSCGMLPFGRCLCGKAAATRQLIYVNHLDEQHEIVYDGIQPHGHYCIPIETEGELFGVLNIYVDVEHVSDESEKKFLKTVADTLAVVIERKQSEERLQQLAHNDMLTGLPNRTLFYDRLNQALALAQRHKQAFAVMFLDLDHFKEINDTLGHDMGDLLLREAATRLRSCVRSMDTVARMGGDEFTIILTETAVREAVEKVAEKLLRELQQPFSLNGEIRHVGCSIGIALYPKHGLDSETLIKHADIAMYDAKRERNSYCFFSDKRLL